MTELKRKVQAVEVNYVCDKCEHGMVERCGEMDAKTGVTPHKCMICGHEHSFKWVSYPRIDYIGMDESL
ncbi:transcription elongation factor Elf1 [Litorivivens lipolytica]|uniref:Transcription elongation factor Elf1 n=1 Tax=Litorivivens lipolytica TaxID=1524264 RepID=A0A7W4W271_9GAMM|nr:type II citrate synthase [Litorivivens lipolytica]MBB3046106.1 transcription elongation factor Elf1 [Litorivivens lipolytica]